jgi:tetratricopeptide (TPR) repeat protein
LRKWREEHSRRSEETVEIWEHVLSRNSGALHDELWAVMEQVVIAAFDCARHDLAIDCLQVLNNQFPKSSRVTKLQALRLESLGKHEEANYLYDKLLESDETNGVGFIDHSIYVCLRYSEKERSLLLLAKDSVWKQLLV